MLSPLLVAPLAAALAWASDPGAGPVLDLGPHGVGFTVLEALDSTRAFRPQRDFRGRAAPETARPVQLSIWYPASPGGDAPRMRAGEFRLLQESEVDFHGEPDRGGEGRLRRSFVERAVGYGQPREVAERLWDGETPAVRGAPPLPGPHPVVLAFTAAGVTDPLLPAYLASHGFVVASFPANGRMTEGSLEFTPNDLTLDTTIDDAGFVHMLLRRLPWADTRRLAVTSFSGGSLAALLWTMRDMQPSAIVAVEGWERYRRGADIVARSVHYDPHRVRVPFLMIERAADEASPQYAKVPDVVGALPYADITRLSFRDAAHGDFLSHAPFGHTPDHAAIYEASTRIIRLFLEATLRHDTAAAASLAALRAPGDGTFAISRDPALPTAPTEEELYRLAETDTAAFAAAYRDAAVDGGGARLFREAVLTRAALFAPGAPERAAIMGVVVDAYPASAVARFRLGEALAEAGRAGEGRDALERALALVDADPGLDEPDRAGWRERIRSALAEVGGGGGQP